MAGVQAGFWNWLGFIVPVMLATVLWEGRKWKLWLFSIAYYLVESDADAPRITTAFEEAARTNRPVVVLVGDEYHGFNR